MSHNIYCPIYSIGKEDLVQCGCDCAWYMPNEGCVVRVVVSELLRREDNRAGKPES